MGADNRGAAMARETSHKGMEEDLKADIPKNSRELKGRLEVTKEGGTEKWEVEGLRGVSLGRS